MSPAADTTIFADRAGPGRPLQPRIYVILGSHACRTSTLMLKHKRIAYRCVTLPTGLHPVAVRALGFSRRTVPALRIDGHRVQSNREIARFLDRVRSDPPLFPADPDRRRAVEEAERWGDEIFQMAARRTVLATALHGPDALHDRGDDGRLGPLLWHHSRARQVGARLVGRFVFDVNERTERELLDSLPGMLDRIDALIEAGVLNAAELNAADFMLVTSLALLCYRRDLRPEVEARPAGALVQRVMPENRGAVAGPAYA